MHAAKVVWPITRGYELDMILFFHDHPCMQYMLFVTYITDHGGVICHGTWMYSNYSSPMDGLGLGKN